MTRTAPAALLAAAALLSGTAAFATTKPHAAKPAAVKTVKVTKTHTVRK